MNTPPMNPEQDDKDSRRAILLLGTLAISNRPLLRDDQVGSALFSPLDAAEARLHRTQQQGQP